MTKFVDDAGLKYFKGKIDENFLNKVKGGDVDGYVNFKKNITATTISGYSATPLTQGTAALKLKDVTGITSGDMRVAGAESAIKVWNDVGGRIAVGKAGGLATLDINGKIPLEQLGNLDTTFVEVVTKLPKTNIGKHMYLLAETAASGVNQNKYAEYIYTGALPINDINAYDAAKWEKLGDFQAEIDLKTCVDNVKVYIDGDSVRIDANHSTDNLSTATIPAATTTQAGVMSAADKNVLNKIAAKYPFGISGISANPNVVEISTKSTPNISWNFANEEFHPVRTQSLQSDNGYIAQATNVPVGTKSYKRTSNTAYLIPDTGQKQVDTITLTVTTTDGNTKTASVTITHVHANYCGIVAANKTSLTKDEIIALGNKAVINGRNRTVSIAQTNQKLVYAYPAYFGDLTSIKDGNGFQGFSGYTKNTVSVNGTIYNVYIQNTPATAIGSYTFA